MREDRQAFSIDSTATSYYLNTTPVDAPVGAPFTYSPDMQAVRRARHGMNARTWPQGPKHQRPVKPKATDADIVRSHQRAVDHWQHLLDVGASISAIQTAFTKVQRSEGRAAAAVARRQEYRTRRIELAVKITRTRLAEAARDVDPSGVEHHVNQLVILDGDRHAAFVLAEDILGSVEVSDRVKRASQQVRRAATKRAERRHAAPSGDRPENGEQIHSAFLYHAGSNNDEHDPNPHGDTVAVVAFAAPQTDAERKQGLRQEFYVTQAWNKRIRVRTDEDVARANVSYFAHGVPILRPPSSGVYTVWEPGDAYHGPFYSADDAAQCADWWLAEMKENDNDPDRFAGFDSGAPVHLVGVE